MARLLIAFDAVILAAGCAAVLTYAAPAPRQSGSAGTAAPAKSAVPAAELDRLLAPIALYPDQLLAQMLLCAANPGKLGALNEWLASQATLKGTALQDAASAAGFEPSFVALALFPDVVNAMASRHDATARIGAAFAADRSGVFGSIQRLRSQAEKAGTLKDTPQQNVESKTTSSGPQVIVIEPANPQVVYVPQYNPQVVYTQSSTVVVQQSSSSSDAVVAGMIGFTAGIAIGAAIDNDYYYGPYGWGRAGYMYNDGWDDWYDEREDAREDWQDHREDLADERGDRREDVADERGDRAGTQQQQRTERATTRSENRPESAARSTTTTESRGYGGERTGTERSGTKSDAFSGYSRGSSERKASDRGQRSRSSSRSSGSRKR